MDKTSSNTPKDKVDSEQDENPQTSRPEKSGHENSDANEKNRNSKLDRCLNIVLTILMTGATITIAVATIIYTHFASKQAIQMERAVVAATEQTKQVGEQFRLDQRPWIGITKISCTLERDKPIIFIITFRNVGKTPAISVTSLARFQHRPTGNPPNFAYDNSQPNSRGIVAPQQDFVLVHNVSETMPQDRQNQVLDAVFANKEMIWILGSIDFDDVFGNHHWLKYCYFYSPEHGMFVAYNEHNDADND